VVAVDALTARDEVLARIARALRDVPDAERAGDVEVPRAYLLAEPGDVVERFVERVSDYKTTVLRVAAGEVAEAIGGRCRELGLGRLAVPDDVPAEWRPEGVELVSGETLDAQGLDAVDGALTGCALAIAETGTIVIDAGPRQGRRALTLVPDYHVCVVVERQIVGGVPEAMSTIAETLRHDRRPVTFVSGPSATSDIELSRVEGVHGPRTLDVVVVGG
jgi:L-lactate dehydrogenase complex protein LldG